MQRRYLRGLLITIAVITLVTAMSLTGCAKKLDPGPGPGVYKSDSSSSKSDPKAKSDSDVSYSTPKTGPGGETIVDPKTSKTPKTPKTPVDPKFGRYEEQAMAQFNTEDIHFAYDSSDLSTEAMAILKAKKEYLLMHPEATAMIQGHCDERGSNEYNLALGDRRANSAKNFLKDLGVNAGRLDTVSYGEENPLAPGHDEAAWATNRRVHFVLQ